MLSRPTASDALQDLLDLGLLAQFAPELAAMSGVEQGSFHFADVWIHTLKVIRVTSGLGRPLLTPGGHFLHDVGKPQTRMVDEKGATRFFGHEALGAEMSKTILRRMKFSNDQVDRVSLLVKNHMRLGSAPEMSAAAARRLIRDLGENLDDLLALVEADAGALKADVRALDLSQIRSRIAEVQVSTPRDTLESPLSGEEIMKLTNLPPGPEVGKAKEFLTELVIEGELAPGDKENAKMLLQRFMYSES